MYATTPDWCVRTMGLVAWATVLNELRVEDSFQFPSLPRAIHLKLLPTAGGSMEVQGR